MSESDLFEHASLLAQALEELRYEVERNRKDAIAQAEYLRQYLLEAGQRPGIDANTFLFVLQQFAVAKLDIGDELRGQAEQVLGNLAVSPPADDAASIEELAKGFKEVANSLNGDPFAIHTEVSEFAQTMPGDVRAMLAGALLAQKDVPALRDAALGWLLNDAAQVRQVVAQMLEQDAVNNSGSTLRRMIALRNWVPEADRPALDRAIKASQKKVACASWPSAKVLEAYASGCDGSGAQSVFMIVAQGRKRALAALLFKQDSGVRDAWVIAAARAPRWTRRCRPWACIWIFAGAARIRRYRRAPFPGCKRAIWRHAAIRLAQRCRGGRTDKRQSRVFSQLTISWHPFVPKSNRSAPRRRPSPRR